MIGSLSSRMSQHGISNLSQAIVSNDYSIYGVKNHLRGIVRSCSAWFVRGNDDNTGPPQLVSSTEIEFQTSHQRTLSIQLHAPGVYGSHKKIKCNCGFLASQEKVTLYNINEKDNVELGEIDREKNLETFQGLPHILSRSSRRYFRCSRYLPDMGEGVRRRRCDFMQMFD